MGFFDFKSPSSVANFFNRNITNALYMASQTRLAIKRTPVEYGELLGDRMESATPKTSRMSHAFFMNGSKWLIESPINYND
ncbi:hypothetical protein D3C76_1347990 [compost metagenome]